MTNLLLSLLLSLALQAISSYVEPENKTVSACFNQTEKTIYANCTAGHMTHLVNVFYGISNSSQCEYHEGDCTQRDDTILPCVGQAVCPINLPSGPLGRMLPACGLYSTYLQANYRCIKESDAVDICQGLPLRDQQGYLKTPRYPYNYPGSRECTTRIIVDPSQKIELYIIDFDLESAPNNDCVDWLELKGNLKSKTFCGRRSQEKTFTTQQNELTIKFQSNEDGENKGFWLYYRAIPPLPETTTSAATSAPPVTPQMPQIPPNSTTVRWWENMVELTSTKSPSVAESRLPVQNQHPAHDVPMEAIVGGVLGTLLFILLVLLLILLIKRQKEREIPSGPTTTTCYMDACTRPHGSTSTPYIQNDLYGSDIDQPYTKV